MADTEQNAAPDGIPATDWPTLWDGYCAWLDERESENDDDTLQ